MDIRLIITGDGRTAELPCGSVTLKSKRLAAAGDNGGVHAGQERPAAVWDGGAAICRGDRRLRRVPLHRRGGEGRADAYCGGQYAVSALQGYERRM